jgi:hypothetical protein
MPSVDATSLELNLAGPVITDMYPTNAAFALTWTSAADGQVWGVRGTNSNAGAPITITIPWSLTDTGAVTSVSVAAGNTYSISWEQRNGVTWLRDSPQIDLTAFVTGSTVSFTGKTFDAAATGNVLKQTKHLFLMRPDYGDGVGAVPQTNSYVASGLTHYTFTGGTAETNANWVVYEAVVPADLDTAVAMTATIGFVSGGTDADTVTFHLTYALGAAGTAMPSLKTGIALLPIVMTTTPTTPASGDVQVSAATTLTGWAATMTPGTPLFICVARLNDSNDDTQREMFLDLAYGSTQ